MGLKSFHVVFIAASIVAYIYAWRKGVFRWD